MMSYTVLGNIPSELHSSNNPIWNHVNLHPMHRFNYTFEQWDTIINHIKNKTKNWYFINLEDVFSPTYISSKSIIFDVLKKHNLKFKMIDNQSNNTMIGITNRELDIDYKDVIKSKQIQKKFLCLNGSYSNHRKDIYDFLINTNIKENTILSFNANHPTDKYHLKIEGYEYTKNSNRFNELYYKTFCNIITETNFSIGMIHISEKTDKSIYGLQPFVIVGNPQSLNRLKKLGFKTFHNWWDESYDDESNPTRRMNKIKQTIREINNFSIEEMLNIYREMLEILIHNKQLAKKIYNKNLKYHDNYSKIYNL